MKRMLALVAGAVLVSGSAWAVPVLTLDDGAGNFLSIVDNGTGDMSPEEGVITFLSSFGAWDLALEVGQTKPFVGSALAPSMHLSSVNTSAGAADLTVTFSDDFFGPLPESYYFQAVAGGVLGAGNGSTLTYNAYWDAGNGVPAATLLTSLAFANPGTSPLGFSDTANSPMLGGADYPYSLTQEIIISHESGGATSVDVALNPVPEPATMVLLGSGLLGIAGVSRRKRGKKA